MRQKISEFLRTTDRVKTTGTVAEFPRDDNGDSVPQSKAQSYCLIGALGCELGLIQTPEDAEWYDESVGRLDTILRKWGVTEESLLMVHTLKQYSDALFSWSGTPLNTVLRTELMDEEFTVREILYQLNDNTSLDFSNLSGMVDILEKNGMIKYEWEK